MNSEENKLYKLAYILSIITIVFNLAEGLVSVFFGYEDGTLTLFGFGVDSFVEVISGIGIYAMILRICKHPDSDKQRFEKTALRTTGISFMMLSAGLAFGAVNNIITGHKPDTTISGAIISIVSIIIMSLIVYNKFRIGKKLGSEAIIADGKCGMVCIYMSLVLLLSSLIYMFTRNGLIDIIGTIGLIYFSVREGREALSDSSD